MGKCGAGEIRRPNIEGRKKPESRNPHRRLVSPELWSLHEQGLAARDALGHVANLPAHSLVRSVFGFRICHPNSTVTSEPPPLYAPGAASSHPGRYSRARHLLASATLVTSPAAASNSSRLPPNRNETAARLKASEIGPASRKSP